MSVVMAGAGVNGGQVVGKTGEKAEEPADAPIKPEDVAVSFYHALCSNAAEEYRTGADRPTAMVRGGKVIKDLVA